MTPLRAPSTRQRLLVSLAVGVTSAAVVLLWGWRSGGYRLGGSDFDQIWFAARAVRNGQDPYTVIGPGRAFDWYPLFYPLPTALVGIPFSFMPLVAARVLFASLSAALFAHALTWQGFTLLPVLLSLSFVHAVVGAQWTPLLTAALILPALGWTLPLKPNVGVAIGAVSRSRTMVFSALLSAAVLAIISWIVLPTWFQEWREAMMTSGRDFPIPVTTLGGPFLLLALLRWRRMDAQLLLVYACLPHTPLIYEVLPLALVASTFREAIAFAFLSDLAIGIQSLLLPQAALGGGETMAARILNITIYLPCLVMVLRRPNVGPLPIVLEYVQYVLRQARGRFPDRRRRTAEGAEVDTAV